MESRRLHLDVDEIVIDEGKAAYIAQRKITEAHVFQVLWNPDFAPHFYERYNAQKQKYEYAMLGRTSGGRFLRIAIELVEDATWRLITAYWRDDREGLRQYEQELRQ